MTVVHNRVVIRKAYRRSVAAFFLICIELVLTFFLYVTLSAPIIWPDDARAAAGVATVLSYEGRLMDELGNPLGGTGEPYCFRFSIYDDLQSGGKIWPAGTPATTVSTTTDGVFSALIGQADTLDLDFTATSTVFLNVEVNTATSTNGSTCSGSWETLSPRQRIGATGYARAAENVYSSLLITDVANNRVQIGSGAGGGSPKMLGLDIKNTNDYIGQSCPTSGTVWYNSAISKALVCEGGTIQTIGNSSATTTIAALTANTGSPATTGTVVFSNSNGVSFGINANTITASVAGPVSMNGFIPYNGSRAMGQAGNASSWMIPMFLDQPLNAGQVVLPVHYSQCTNSTITVSLSVWVQIFTRNGDSLSNLVSASYSHTINGSGTQGGSVSNSYSGLRHLTMALNTTLTEGNYFFGFLSRTSTAGANGSLSNVVISSPNNSFSGFFGSASTNSQGYYGLGYGTFSATRSTTTGSINISDIRHSAALLRSQPFFFFTSTYT